MENPRFSTSLFRAGFSCLLAVLILALTPRPGFAGSDIDIAKLKARAEQGDASAQFDLGLAYAGGRGVPKNLTHDVKWYRKAADQGHADAQYHLGRIASGNFISIGTMTQQ
jgi:TPR repeat protein